ncbi:UbiH/UbiF/VisC/COQ6 family ubiquinone biosynthesis hydroxylase [Acidisoma silvae]|uniref:UbiH/UbiF/VisC/COQ6 family ubiquinone biosynthesis hydroxylase n=1 Tax=Acidisoma silvae TaxID=2802396 RepID=A0A964DYA7_9PROT|nr:UbiH/UbiF/VisC/COQ6 family ubiquinone biosynthesis hydroxylase [Acidisoma silvae]MCB8874862.1 UbiH/UbiF/VisC/COQ6 family ubiquinone biosynthesis hydroxylase [Acidisoma silvae]
MSDTEFDVCILGAGPVGGALACQLAESGARVLIVDRAALPPMEDPGFDGRAYAIAAGTQPLLDDAALWQALPFQPCPIEQIHVSDGKPGRPASPLFLHFDRRELGEASGPFGWMVEARSLRIALNRRLHAGRGVTLAAPATARVERRADGVTVRLSTGLVAQVRLVIAAEGRQSPLRREANIPVIRYPYRQSGVVCAIAHEYPHENTALEHFLPGGPFAQLPLGPTAGAPHVSAIVFTEKTAVADALMRMDSDSFTHQVARRLGDHLGPIRLLGRRWNYPLSALLATRYVDQRLALVGDAAHGIHPIAGQGFNLGLRDAIVLSDLIGEALASGNDPGEADMLARYQRQRRPDNLAMLAATDALDRLFSNDNPAIRLARDLGIAAVHRLPPVKRFFMKRAMGISG